MINYNVDTDDLRKFIDDLRRFDSKSVVAEALNMLGDGVRHKVIEGMVAQTGLRFSDLERLVESNPATGRRLRYSIRIKESDLKEALGSRKFEDRGWDKGRNADFDEKLVNVRTMQDSNVCPICEQIAEEGPYSIAEINHLKVLHPHFLNSALNCRCNLVPFSPKKRMTLVQETSLVPDGEEIVRLTLGQMADEITKHVKASFKIRRRR